MWSDERKKNIINVLIIGIIIALLSTLYIMSGMNGLLLGLVNVGIVVGLTYWYLSIENLKRIAALTIGCLALIVIFYMALGSNGPITLFYLDIIALAIVVGFKLAESGFFTEVMRGIKYNNRVATYSQRSQRTCIICGNPLRSRIKYCSQCRPTGRRYPYGEESDYSPSTAVWTPRRSSVTEIFGGRSSSEQFIGGSRKRDYIGNTYSNKSFEDYVGKQKKKRYY